MRLLLLLLCAVPLGAQKWPAAREIFKQLIEIDTTDSVGDNTRAAEAMAARCRAAGYAAADIQLLAPAPRKGNLVLRLRGKASARPILFIGHLDVVEARKSDWSFDPFVFREQDGYYYGRGTQDMKADVAVLVANFIRLKQEGFVPERDLILALTSDEEGGKFDGVEWLMKDHRPLIDAEYCVNSDGGGGAMEQGKHSYMAVQAAEKVFLTFQLQATNSGGHSSRPTRDNAIYRIANALGRIEKFDFPVHLSDVTRAYFERMAGIVGGTVGADMKAIVQNPKDAVVAARLSESPFYNAQLRTTCVATMLTAGHAENALPQTATATVNCRLLPNDSPDEIERALREVTADPKIAISRLAPPKPSPSLPIDARVMAAVTAATHAQWPGIPIIPVMDTGATDGVWLRTAGIPTYGVNGNFIDINDGRAHGRDERIGVTSFEQSLDFMYSVIKRLAQSR